MSRALISPGARPPLQCHRQKWTLLVALGASGCLQSLQPLDRAAAMPPTADPSATPTTAILAAAPPIALSLDDDMAVTNDPCAKTNQDKTEILTVYCAKCHSGPAERAQGLPGRFARMLWPGEHAPTGLSQRCPGRER